MTDEEIIVRYRIKADKHWVGMLYERYAHLVLGLCFKYLKNKERAEDMTCDIFESLFDKLLKHDIKSFRSWIYVTSRNHCLMALRKSKGHFTTELNGDLQDKGLSAVQIKELEEQKFQLLESTLNLLKAEQEKCLRSFYLERKSYQEVSELFDMPISKVKSHIQNGKRKLKILLEQHEEFHGNK